MKKLILILSLFSSICLFAQEKDFAIWYSISARHEILKNIRIDVSEELRAISNASETDQFFTDLGLNYKFNKHISLGGYYRFIRKRENNDEFYSRNRFYGDLELKYPLKRFELSYRFRFQRQINKYADDVEEKAPILHNRHKIILDYNVPNIKLTPKLFYERFYRLKYINSYFADNVRYGAGLSYSFNKRHKVNMEYMINEDLHPNKKKLYILALGYNLSLK